MKRWFPHLIWFPAVNQCSSCVNFCTSRGIISDYCYGIIAISVCNYSHYYDHNSIWYRFFPIIIFCTTDSIIAIIDSFITDHTKFNKIVILYFRRFYTICMIFSCLIFYSNLFPIVLNTCWNTRVVFMTFSGTCTLCNDAIIDIRGGSGRGGYFTH